MQSAGFHEVTRLINSDRNDVVNAIDRAIKASGPDDLLAIYYAGASFRSTDVGASGPPLLVLPTKDVRIEQVAANLTLEDLVKQVSAAKETTRLIIIDGCHGTFGFTPPISPNKHERTFQVLAGSQDEELSYELPQVGGGLSTRALLEHLTGAGARGTSTPELLAAAAEGMIRYSGKLGGRNRDRS